ncbi:MAG: ankyrin repeat domain-containing protein, partial [Burkholderiales bacterium]
MKQYLSLKAKYSAKDENIIHMAVRMGYPHMLSWVCHIAEVNEVNKMGKTPLHLAIRKKDIRLVRVLLEFEARFDIKDSKGRNAFVLATQLADSEIISLIHSRVPRLGKVKSILLVNQIKQGTVDLSDALAQGLPLNFKDQAGGDTILHLAVRYSQPQVVRLLINRFAMSINGQNEYGETPLHIAAQLGLAHHIEVLLLERADYYIRDKDGFIPYARVFEHDDYDTYKACAHIFYQYNADDCLDNLGRAVLAKRDNLFARLLYYTEILPPFGNSPFNLWQSLARVSDETCLITFLERLDDEMVLPRKNLQRYLALLLHFKNYALLDCLLLWPWPLTRRFYPLSVVVKPLLDRKAYSAADIAYVYQRLASTVRTADDQRCFDEVKQLVITSNTRGLVNALEIVNITHLPQQGVELILLGLQHKQYLSVNITLCLGINLNQEVEGKTIFEWDKELGTNYLNRFINEYASLNSLGAVLEFVFEQINQAITHDDNG